MIIELQREDLLLLVRQIASRADPSQTKRYKAAFEIRPYANGPMHRLCEAWAKEQTDEELLIFCNHYLPSIKHVKEIPNIAIQPS